MVAGTPELTCMLIFHRGMTVKANILSVDSVQNEKNAISNGAMMTFFTDGVVNILQMCWISVRRRIKGWK